MKRAIFTLMIFIVLSGCASIFPTTQNYDNLLNNWVGKHVDNLVKSWGPPQGSYELSDGGTVIEYFRSHIVKYNYMSMHQEDDKVLVDTLWCRTIFIMNQNGIITSWNHEGNDCRALPPK